MTAQSGANADGHRTGSAAGDSRVGAPPPPPFSLRSIHENVTA
jgi:hypothetical protein